MMHFSHPVKCKVFTHAEFQMLIFTASKHSLPSPNGAYIATVVTSTLSIRDTRTLQIAHSIALPPELSTSIIWYLWSPCSTRILVGSADLIRVCSPSDALASATITLPTSGASKASFVCFGASADEVCVFTDLGLKVSVFDLLAATSVDIPSPKFYAARNATRGFACRPGSGNAALLTRRGGKDVLSIHARRSYEVLRSWTADTVDAQSLQWSPDGRFIALVDSAAHGHKLLLYTADGHLFKVWKGPSSLSLENQHVELGAGIRGVEWSSQANWIAINDYRNTVTILAAPSYSQTFDLRHSVTVEPSRTCQVR